MSNIASPYLVDGKELEDQSPPTTTSNSTGDHYNHDLAQVADFSDAASQVLSLTSSSLEPFVKIEDSPLMTASPNDRLVNPEYVDFSHENLDLMLNDASWASDMDVQAEDIALQTSLKSPNVHENPLSSEQESTFTLRQEPYETHGRSVTGERGDDDHLQQARYAFQRGLATNLTDAPAAQSTRSSSQPDIDGCINTAVSQNKISPMLIDSEAEDEDATARFRKLQKSYRKKMKNGELPMKDIVMFRKAQNSEEQRQRRRARERALSGESEAKSQGEGDDPGKADQPKQNEGLFCSDNESCTNVERDGDTSQGRDEDCSKPLGATDEPPHKKTRKARRNAIPEKALMASMEPGRQLSKQAAVKKEKRKKPNKDPTKRRGASARVPKPKGDRVTKPRAKPSGKRSRVKGGPQMTNVESIWRNDIIGDAGAMQGREGQATFAATNRKDALAELIASVPEDQRKPYAQTKKALHEACKNFNWKGKGTMQPDGGKWHLKGMKTSLMPHQLLGASWMREREDSSTRPWGGIVADSMGFGKTIMCLANILDGRPSERSPNRTTLIVCPSSLCTQWLTQITTHVQEDVLGSIMIYRSGSRIITDNLVKSLSSCGVIITTYHEVLRSYPSIEEPLHLQSAEARDKFWKEKFETDKGPLHRVFFRRIILDEATVIKNWKSKITIACNGLAGKYRWVLTGTPIHNGVEELYPYFKFTQVPNTGTFETFKENFCGRTEASMGRLHAFLRSVMLRRTLGDEMFGRPILKLPPINQQIILVDFDPTERAIYGIVKSRFISKINEWSKGGKIDNQFHGVCNLYLRLRQLCGHVLLIRKVMIDLLLMEDFEKLHRLTERQFNLNQNSDGLRTMGGLRQILEKSPKSSDDHSELAAPSGDEVLPDTTQASGGQRFSRFLSMSKESGKWDEIWARSLCYKCHQVPEEPHITVPCHHVYCKECLTAMLFAIRDTEEQKALCLACQSEFEGSEPCVMHEQAASGMEEPDSGHLSDKGRQGSSKSVIKENDWFGPDGIAFPSAKTTAVKAQLKTWLSEDPDTKVVVFTQFLDLMRIIARSICSEGWSWCEFKGSMNPEQRDRSISDFASKPDVRIMLAGLKCGGLGLNLTMANKVILLDPWWNEAVEDQAWSRVYRIGQQKEVEIRRFCVRGTIDTDVLLQMQARKNKEIHWAIGPDSQPEKQTVESLMRLFGAVTFDKDTGQPVINEEGDSAFIYIDDERQDIDTTSDVEILTEPPPRPF